MTAQAPRLPIDRPDKQLKTSGEEKTRIFGSGMLTELIDRAQYAPTPVSAAGATGRSL